MPWWDRSCDLALIVGTFIHGLGNYEAMRNDKEIPFGRRTAQFIIADSGSALEFRYLRLATMTARKVFDSALSAAKYKAHTKSHESVADTVAASKLVSDEGSMIKIGSTPKYSKMNPTYYTDKPQSFQTPNALENSSQRLKGKNHFSWSNLATQVGKDKIEDSDEITFHCLSTSMLKDVNISLIYISSVYFFDVKLH